MRSDTSCIARFEGGIRHIFHINDSRRKSLRIQIENIINNGLLF